MGARDTGVPGSRLLVVRVGAMGDVLHGLPAVTALRQARPDLEIGWVIDRRWLALLESSGEHQPLVDRVHAIDTRLWKRRPLSIATVQSITALRAELRAEQYDVCIDLQGSLRSATIARLSGARHVVGSAAPREWPARLAYSRAVETASQHVIEQMTELASAAIGVALSPAEVELPRDAPAEAWWLQHAEQMLREAPAQIPRWEARSGETRPFVVLVPQAGWGAKQWPAERLGQVALQLREEGYAPVVNALSLNDPLAARVVEASRGAATAAMTDLPQLIALLRRAALVIAGDTGPLHLAAALRRPVVALFGPTDPARTGPFGTRARVLRHTSSVTDHSRHTAPEGGLLQITADAVVEAALGLLHETKAGENLI